MEYNTNARFDRARTNLFCLFCGALLLFFANCRQPVPAKTRDLFSSFPAHGPGDTLHVEVSTESDAPVLGDTIPNALFFSAIPQPFLKEIDYLADSTDALVLGRQRFSLNDSMEACWAEIRQFWFQHHSLLTYNKLQKAFTGRITVAEWYGGDGGQILIGSWLFDYDGDGDKDIVRREIQHSLVPAGDSVLDRTSESATLLLWDGKQFSEAPAQDIKSMIRHYPIQTQW
jgi:hypothetical protein